MPIRLITGDGPGKTTSSLGIALRMLGHGHNVVMIQWMKNWENTGEYKIQEVFGERYKVYQFGQSSWLKLSEEKTEYDGKVYGAKEIERKDRVAAYEGLKKAEEVIGWAKKPNLLILDEICLAAGMGLLEVDEVVDLMNKIPKEMYTIMTGRNAPQKILDNADYVIIEKLKKAPENYEAREGIEF